MKYRTNDIVAKTGVILLTVLILLVMLFPFFVMMTVMLRDPSEVYVVPPRWLPTTVTFVNLIEVWSKFKLSSYFSSSILIAAGTMILNTLICVPAAYAIARLRFPGRQSFLFGYLIIQMFSPIIVLIALFKEFAVMGLLDSFIGLIIVNTVFTLSFTTWMMFGYMKGIPASMEEAAMIDGCGRFSAIVRIILPMAAPGLVTVMIYTFIFAWNEFMCAFTFIRSTAKMPLTVGLYTFIGRSRIEWEYLTSAAFFATIPIVILFYTIEKRLVGGLVMGAVKE